MVNTAFLDNIETSTSRDTMRLAAPRYSSYPADARQASQRIAG